MRLHLVGLPHTQTIREVSVCAFTQKIIKFCKMMKPLGYQIVLYAGDENEAECAELVTLVSRDEQREWYGPFDLNMIPFQANQGGEGTPWSIFNGRAIEEIGKRVEPDDQILITAGNAQQSIYEAFPNHTVAEWAAGYEGVFAKYACFESYAWMHHPYGKHLSYNHGRWYDAVIPNFFDLDDWETLRREEAHFTAQAEALREVEKLTSQWAALFAALAAVLDPNEALRNL
jgi:hypothetical protein